MKILKKTQMCALMLASTFTGGQVLSMVKTLTHSPHLSTIQKEDSFQKRNHPFLHGEQSPLANYFEQLGQGHSALLSTQSDNESGYNSGSDTSSYDDDHDLPNWAKRNTPPSPRKNVTFAKKLYIKEFDPAQCPKNGNPIVEKNFSQFEHQKNLRKNNLLECELLKSLRQKIEDKERQTEARKYHHENQRNRRIEEYRKKQDERQHAAAKKRADIQKKEQERLEAIAAKTKKRQEGLTGQKEKNDTARNLRRQQTEKENLQKKIDQERQDEIKLKQTQEAYRKRVLKEVKNTEQAHVEKARFQRKWKKNDEKSQTAKRSTRTLNWQNSLRSY